jgi:hypothetical protein
MIRVEIWMVPQGVEESKYRLGAMAIANDATGTATVGNYNFARIGKTGQTLKGGRVEQFPRLRLNVWNLIQRCLKECL